MPERAAPDVHLPSPEPGRRSRLGAAPRIERIAASREGSHCSALPRVVILDRVHLESRVENVSWASFGVDATTDRHGRDVALVVAKVAYVVSPQGAPRLALAPVRREAQAEEGGGVRFPADLGADEKPGTDVGLVGTAHPPPRGSGRSSAFAWVSMGPLRKVVTVFGPRVYTTRGWRGGVLPSDPGPLVDPVPLRFDQAYGGTDALTGETEAWNPAGVGFASDPLRLPGRPAPRLAPVAPEGSAGLVPHPSHGVFAPIPAHWEPRRSLIGTHDEAWARTRAPVRPRDFDPRHHCWSVPELYSAAPLLGDEVIEVGGVLAEGLWRFQLPRYAVRFESRVDGRDTAHETHLDSVLLDADRRSVELSFRVAIPLPRKWERVERIRVLGVGTLPEDVIRGPGATPALSAARSA